MQTLDQDEDDKFANLVKELAGDVDQDDYVGFDKDIALSVFYFRENSTVFFIVRFISFEQWRLKNLYILVLRELFMTQNFVISSYYLPSISKLVFPFTFVSSAELSISESSLVESFLKRFHYVTYLRPE